MERSGAHAGIETDEFKMCTTAARAYVLMNLQAKPEDLSSLKAESAKRFCEQNAGNGDLLWLRFGITSKTASGLSFQSPSQSHRPAGRSQLYA